MTSKAEQPADNEQPTLVLSEPLKRLKARAEGAGLRAEASEGWVPDSVVLRVYYPEGRDARPVEYATDDVGRLESVDLGTIRFLPDTLAFVDTHTGGIEAQVRTRNSALFKRVPGFETIDPSESEMDDEQDGNVVLGLPASWRIAVGRAGVWLELSPMSDQFRAVRSLSSRSKLVTFKVSGLEHDSTEETVRSLRTLSDSFFFDLDVRYGIVVDLFPAPSRPVPMPKSRMTTPPVFPTSKYLSQPVSLYKYGRSAMGLPLLSFLAFYQVLEFFFPIFTQEEVTKRVRQTLQNPRFDVSDEVSLLRLVDAIKPSIRFGVPEREQLRATVRRCLDLETLRTFIKATDHTSDYFCKRPQAISGVQPLRPDTTSPDLRDQVADRIYDIRCRIVHTKSDGGDGSVDLLLPTGPEARSLGPDIELVRLAAQEAIIAGASPLDLRQVAN